MHKFRFSNHDDHEGASGRCCLNIKLYDKLWFAQHTLLKYSAHCKANNNKKYMQMCIMMSFCTIKDEWRP